jgi:hypothetical protein
MALVAPQVWEDVKKWRNGYLTEAQAERFIQLVLDESVFAEEATVMEFEGPMLAENIRFGKRRPEDEDFNE